MNLKYLFEVEYVDGTVFSQTKEDISTIDSKRSAFYDVLQSGKKIKKFTLRRFINRYSIDLITGEFDINGTSVIVETDKPVPRIEKHFDLKLVYYRQHKQHMDVNYNMGSKKILGVEPQTDTVTYYFGYETVINKKKYTRVIGIN
jgi:hypothetical protein